jgi:thiol:disulfide interchange protein
MKNLRGLLAPETIWIHVGFLGLSIFAAVLFQDHHVFHAVKAVLLYAISATIAYCVNPSSWKSLAFFMFVMVFAIFGAVYITRQMGLYFYNEPQRTQSSLMVAGQAAGYLCRQKRGERERAEARWSGKD